MENNVFLKIKACLVAALGAFTAAFGWFGILVLVWVGCMIADWLSGSAAAAKRGEWSSQVARDGIWHKAGMMVAVLVAAVTDIMIGTVLGNLGLNLGVTYTVLICPIVVCWYIFTELGSILENAAKMGAPIWPGLRKVLAAAKDAAENVATENKE